MRTLKLTHEDIWFIENALQYVYDKKLETIRNFHKVIEQDERELMLATANKYFDVLDKLSSGNSDV